MSKETKWRLKQRNKRNHGENLEADHRTYPQPVVQQPLPEDAPSMETGANRPNQVALPMFTANSTNCYSPPSSAFPSAVSMPQPMDEDTHMYYDRNGTDICGSQSNHGFSTNEVCASVLLVGRGPHD